MNNLFLVGAKLLGIYFITTASTVTIALIFRAPHLPSVPDSLNNATDELRSFYTLIEYASIVVQFIMGAFLVFCTSIVERIVGIKKPSIELEGVSNLMLLLTGISLIGMTFTLNGLHYIVSRSFLYFDNSLTKLPIDYGKILIFILALVMTFSPKSVASLIVNTKKSKK